MISTGTVRRVDALGRFVIPMELRQMLDIKVGGDLEIWREGESIVVRKYTPTCLFCGGCEGLERYKSKLICRDCLGRLAALRYPEEGTAARDR